MAAKVWKIAGINFDHMHMGDLLRMAHEHPAARIVGVCDEDPSRTQTAADNFGVPADQRYTDYRRCLEETRPDVCVLCPATAEHADWVERVAPYGVHVLVEKPFAASLRDADRMIGAARAAQRTLVINWPLAWYPPHLTAKRFVDEGAIGEVTEVHYYDGNRGPLRHLADKVEVDEREAARLKAESWWYKPERGGGSLRDYLGYGVTLGTWFLNDSAPLEVTAIVDAASDLEVDEHSVTVVRYARGLSKFETRWGTFSDPWTRQPQPKCGFVIVGTKGTISSYDYEETIGLQTAERPDVHHVPVDRIAPPLQNPIQYLIHCLDSGEPARGPLSPEISRAGQRIVDAAVLSVREKRTVTLGDQSEQL